MKDSIGTRSEQQAGSIGLLRRRWVFDCIMVRLVTTADITVTTNDNNKALFLRVLNCVWRSCMVMLSVLSLDEWDSYCGEYTSSHSSSLSKR